MGSGRTIALDGDPWIPGISNFKLQPIQRQQLWAFQWVMEDEWEWNLDIIRQSCSEEEVAAIRRIPIGPQYSDDTWVWHHEKSGIFSVKTAYHSFRVAEMNRLGTGNPNHPSCSTKAWKWLWSLSLPPKIRSFIWRLSRNAVATKRNLWFRRCNPSPVCSICEVEVDDIRHCLFQCPHAARVWHSNFPSLILPHDSTPIVMWLLGISESIPLIPIPAVVACLWAIWLVRNERVFKGVSPSTYGTSLKAVSFFSVWTSQGGLSLPTSRDQHAPRHPTLSLPPCLNHWVIHCDGTFSSESQLAAYGVVIKNPLGQVVDGFAGTLFCSAAIVAEAKAILIAMQHVVSVGISATIYSDCKVLVDTILNTSKAGPWQVRAWIQWMRQILHANGGIKIAFLSKEGEQMCGLGCKRSC
ncbi:unnamed protein product [Linum trigynum]|uniref:Reverse transcriptase zinc-binding domain-containing protein n=1 Tax=Linum trigynum TaxID=586398 RepID=A0AAV2DHW9_9ROSI